VRAGAGAPAPPADHDRRHWREKTLRLVAKYADASHMFALGVDALAAKLDTLARHCEAE
jgi:hypothetical protein